MLIQGAISSHFADVDETHRVKADSVSRTKDNFINSESGKVWSLSFRDVDPAGAGDDFFYLKNTGVLPLRLTDIRLSSTVTGIAFVKQVSGSPSYVAESAISPLSRRTSKNPVLQAEASTDTNITGLTSTGDYFPIALTADSQGHLRTSSNIIIDPGGAVAIEWAAATGVITGVVSIVENGIT